MLLDLRCVAGVSEVCWGDRGDTLGRVMRGMRGITMWNACASVSTSYVAAKTLEERHDATFQVGRPEAKVADGLDGVCGLPPHTRIPPSCGLIPVALLEFGKGQAGTRGRARERGGAFDGKRCHEQAKEDAHVRGLAIHG